MSPVIFSIAKEDVWLLCECWNQLPTSMPQDVNKCLYCKDKWHCKSTHLFDSFILEFLQQPVPQVISEPVLLYIPFPGMLFCSSVFSSFISGERNAALLYFSCRNTCADMARLDVTETFHGIRFPGHLHTQDSLNYATSFKFLETDTVIVTYPKSGNMRFPYSSLVPLLPGLCI